MQGQKRIEKAMACKAIEYYSRNNSAIKKKKNYCACYLRYVKNLDYLK